MSLIQIVYGLCTVMFYITVNFRSIHISEPRNGKLFTTKVVVVRFLENEANLPTIQEKVKLAMGNDEMYVLTDSHGNQVIESEGTTGN